MSDAGFGIFLLLLAAVASGVLWRAYARRRNQVPACPNCERVDGVVRISSETTRVDFHEVLGGGHGANVEPVLTLQVSYACSRCGRQWKKQERQYT